MRILFISSILALGVLSVHAQDYTQGLAIWFDTPNAFENVQAWESQSLPIGNGSLGANIMGSIGTERITFNEKTLWRGGPNTSQGPLPYWDANKESAHLLDEIRQAFADGDDEKAALLMEDVTVNEFDSTYYNDGGTVINNFGIVNTFRCIFSNSKRNNIRCISYIKMFSVIF